MAPTPLEYPKMSSPSRPNRNSGKDSVTQFENASAPIRSESTYSEQARSLLGNGPRKRTLPIDSDGDLTSLRRPFFQKLTVEEIRQKKAELTKNLDAAEQSSTPLCTRHRADLSDSHPKGPWSGKVILALDGGGVKGYSSLLVLKRLVALIGEIERGLRRHNLPHNDPQYYDPHVSSEDCPWNPQEAKDSTPPTPIDEESEEDLSKSVRHTLETPQSHDFKLHHYIDYVAGTSTGGLTAILLGRLEMSVERALEQYDIVGNEVFGKPRFIHSTMKVANYVREKYSEKRMEASMISVIRNGLQDELRLSRREEQEQRKYASEAAFLSDASRCRTIVLAFGPSGRNKNVQHTYLFRTYNHPHPSPWAPEHRRKLHLNPGNATADPIWKVARATSAAPKYFAPISFNDRAYRDGAIGANNPAKVALDEVLQMHSYPPKMLLSIGTGLQKNGLRQPKSPRKLRLASGWRDVFKAMTQIITQSEDTANRAQETCENEGVYYYRWNVPAVGDVRLDEWEPPTTGKVTKAKMLEHTMRYLSEKSVHLRLVQYARDLVELRRQRAATERWEVFARKFLYFCPEPSCHHLKATQTFLTRDDLRDHGIYGHSYITNVDVKDCNGFSYACVYDQCGVGDMYVFRTQQDFENHLIDAHNVDEPVFMSRRRMEGWLDAGRMTQLQAMQRHDSYEEANKAADATENGPSSPRRKMDILRSSNSWRGLNTPLILEHKAPCTPDRSTISQQGDDQPGSSKSSAVTPSPARSHKDAMLGAGTNNGDGIVSAHPLSQCGEELLPPRSRRMSLRSPITFRIPWSSNIQAS